MHYEGFNCSRKCGSGRKKLAISNARFIEWLISHSESLALERLRLNNAYISRLEAFSAYKLLIADFNQTNLL
ncbi:MAG: hypothetical protein HC906_15500 [Bacteroidales bacterium]|nr:hypothetical protein [Bacteroidales bacterium]